MLDSNNDGGTSESDDVTTGQLDIVDAGVADPWAWLETEPQPTMMRAVEHDPEPLPAASDPLDEIHFEAPAPVVDEPPRPARRARRRPTPTPAAAEKRPGWVRRHSALVIALGLLIVAGAGIVGAVASLTGSSPSSATADMNDALPTVPASSTPAAAAADADCPNVTNGPVTTGRDAGSTASGPGVIKAFDYAYYVTRSGAQARSFVAPTAAVSGADQIQAAINRLDPQTLHCLKITDSGAGLFDVQLTEQPPRGADPVVIHQKIQTAADSTGKFSIISIQQGN